MLSRKLIRILIWCSPLVLYSAHVSATAGQGYNVYYNQPQSSQTYRLAAEGYNFIIDPDSLNLPASTPESNPQKTQFQGIILPASSFGLDEAQPDNAQPARVQQRASPSSASPPPNQQRLLAPAASPSIPQQSPVSTQTIQTTAQPEETVTTDQGTTEQEPNKENPTRQGPTRKYWYFYFATGPVAYPITYDATLAIGGIINRRLELGIYTNVLPVRFDSAIANADGLFSSIANQLDGADINRLVTQLQTTTGDGRSQLSTTAEITERGIEMKVVLGSFILPIRYKQLNLKVGPENALIANRLFKLKPEYANEDITRFLDGKQISIISVDLANRFRMGVGIVDIKWISLGIAVEQPQQLETIYNLGFFGFDFGIQG